MYVNVKSVPHDYRVFFDFCMHHSIVMACDFTNAMSIKPFVTRLDFQHYMLYIGFLFVLGKTIVLRFGSISRK